MSKPDFESLRSLAQSMEEITPNRHGAKLALLVCMEQHGGKILCPWVLRWQLWGSGKPLMISKVMHSLPHRRGLFLSAFGRSHSFPGAIPSGVLLPVQFKIACPWPISSVFTPHKVGPRMSSKANRTVPLISHCVFIVRKMGSIPGGVQVVVFSVLK